MQIKRAWIDSYVRQLNAISANAQEALKRALAGVDMEDPNAMQTIMEAMNAICGWSSEQSANMAAIFYDGLREIDKGAPFGAEAMNLREPGATYTATASILESGEATAIEHMLNNRISYEVKRAAGDCVMWNTHRERAVGVGTVGYARIPGGSKTYPGGCPFCQMLASRGFVYHTAESAGDDDPDHYHPDCNCAVVPSWDTGTTAEDYNPDEEWDNWKQYVEDKAIARSQENGTSVDSEMDAIYREYGEAAKNAHRRNGRYRHKPNARQRYVI